jgi:16S rRNA (cytidine1402-2'-O)-methyltransferase
MTGVQTGSLHLIPVTLGGDDVQTVLPRAACEVLADLDYFIVENEKSARHFLKQLPHPRTLRELTLERFDKDGSPERAEQLLQPLLSGRSAAVLSEAGCPAIADPGAQLVAAAHRANIPVVPHVGPSALLLALMASGFNGQRFAFHGYLPVIFAECRVEIQTLERESRERDMTQLFIETPYRNDALLKTLLDCCQTRTRLCVAADLTLPTQTLNVATIGELRARTPEIGRRPAVFLLYAR